MRPKLGPSTSLPELARVDGFRHLPGRKPSHKMHAPADLPGHLRVPKVPWLERAHKKQQLSVKDDFHTSHSLGARPLGALRGGSVMSAKTHPSRKRCCHIRHAHSKGPTYLMRWASQWATTWYDSSNWRQGFWRQWRGRKFVR